MSREALGGAIVATTAGAVVAEPILSTMGVIFMGAFGGALFALMNQGAMDRFAGARFVIKRWLFSQVMSWPLFAVAHSAVGDLDLNVPQTVVMMAWSFLIACPKEAAQELEPLWDLILRLKPRSKE